MNSTQIIETAKELLLFVEKDGTPVDGFRFKEVALKLRSLIDESASPSPASGEPSNSPIEIDDSLKAAWEETTAQRILYAENKNRFIFAHQLKPLLNLYDREQISFSRFCELINIICYQAKVVPHETLNNSGGWIEVEKALNLAQAEIRSCYKRLNIGGSNILDLVDKALELVPPSNQTKE